MSLNDILWDPDILPVGMHIESDNHELHGILFQHDSHTCRSSFQVSLESLRPLVSSTPQESVCKNPTGCDQRCQNAGAIEPCRLECRFAPYHNLMMKMIESRDAGGAITLTEDRVAMAG